MQDAMHAARLSAAYSALLALLIEHSPGLEADAVQVTLSMDDVEGITLDVLYTRGGVAVGGEGV